MKLSSPSSVALAIYGLSAALHAQAATLTFVNNCDYQIGLYDNAQEVPMAPSASLVRSVGEGFKGMFRAGKSPQATLAEFTFDGGKLWFDISIIPTSTTQGPEYCSSLAACKQLTGGTGYNEPMQIAPQSNTNGAHCRVLTCLNDGCEDAYLFPKDDIKTHNCPGATNFVVTFCPGEARAVTPASTTAPVYTTAPPTQAPTSRPPTQAPTTRPPTQAPTTRPPTPAPTPAPTPTLTLAPTPVTVTPAANTASNTTTGVDDEAARIAETRSLPTEDDDDSATPVPTTKAPEEERASSDEEAEAPAAAAATTEPPVTEASTKSAPTSSATLSVLVVGAFAIAAVAAVVVIVVVRRKKRALDAQTDKSPILNPGLATL